MKYLFFFNGQLLLLCCVCCKIAIQDFVTRLQKKIRKIYGFTDGYTDRNNPSVFHRKLKKITGLCHFHRQTKTRRYFIESCKKFTGLCHNHRRNHRRTYAHPEAHACQTRVRLHKYQQIEKSGRTFKLFWCAFQLIFDGITDGI